MQNADCCDVHEPLLTLAVALERAAQAIEPISEMELVPLGAADGRILAEEVLHVFPSISASTTGTQA